MSTVVLPVRVRREVREEIERLGVDVRSVVEKALKHMNVSVDEWVKTIKEGRYER
jgi:hypothetical protein